MRTHEVARWFSLLGQLMAVGFSLQQAVSFTTRALPKERDKIVVIESKLREGHHFSSAIRPYVDVDLQAQLFLAESHGNLSETLAELGTYLTARRQQRRKLVGLMQYPLILFSLLALLMVALQMFVFPELQNWQSMSTQYWWQLIPWKLIVMVVATIVIVMVVCQFQRWRQEDANGRAAYLSKLPVVGKMFRFYYSYYLVSNLAVMLTHGLSIRECCEVTAKLNPSSLLAWWGRLIARSGKSGADLLAAIRVSPYLTRELPLFFERGLSVNELAAELTAYHRLLFQRLIVTTEQLLVFVQPVMFIILALMIIGMYLSILLPIYHSLQGVY